MTTLLQTMEIETAPNPDFAVIWMHGLGADANDFVPIVPELHLPKSMAVRFVFPNAPVIPVTANGGYRMRAWFDILAFGGSPKADEAGIKAAMASIVELIVRENARGIPAARIVLAGFSQGAAMAYMVGLGYTEPLAGIMALSGFIPAPALIAAGAPGKLSIFAGHGSHDDVVGLFRGEQARDFALGRGHEVQWQVYPMRHSVAQEEIAHIAAWLRQRIESAPA
jgi:phospholipase/carboxylesterase